MHQIVRMRHARRCNRVVSFYSVDCGWTSAAVPGPTDELRRRDARLCNPGGSVFKSDQQVPVAGPDGPSNSIRSSTSALCAPRGVTSLHKTGQPRRSPF